MKNIVERLPIYIGLVIACFIVICAIMVIVQIIENPELITFGGF